MADRNGADGLQVGNTPAPPPTTGVAPQLRTSGALADASRQRRVAFGPGATRRVRRPARDTAASGPPGAPFVLVVEDVS